MNILNQAYSDLLVSHQEMLSYCISEDLEDEKQEALALFESELITQSEQEIVLDLPKKENNTMPEEELKDEIPEIKVSQLDTSMEEVNTAEVKTSDFLSKKFVGPI